MVRLSSRENRILIVAGIVIVVAVGYQGGYKLFRERISTLDAQVEGQLLKLEKNHKILQKQKSIERAYAAAVNRIRQSRGDEQEMTYVLSEIESVANNISVPVSDMKPQRVRKVDFYNQFSVNLTIEGELLKILEFIHLLESPPSGFEISDLRLDKNPSVAGKIKCLLTVSKFLVP